MLDIWNECYIDKVPEIVQHVNDLIVVKLFLSFFSFKWPLLTSCSKNELYNFLGFLSMNFSFLSLIHRIFYLFFFIFIESSTLLPCRKIIAGTKITRRKIAGRKSSRLFLSCSTNELYDWLGFLSINFSLLSLIYRQLCSFFLKHLKKMLIFDFSTKKKLQRHCIESFFTGKNLILT